jgi:DNA-directed RNA polymerase specialized sigma24 family protein
MIGDAIIKMMTALTRKRFKCDSGYNPFSYFTKVAYRAFQNRIKKEKKEHDTIHSANDTLDRINYPLMLEIVRMNVAFIAKDMRLENVDYNSQSSGSTPITL